MPWVGEGPAPDTRFTPHQFVEPKRYDEAQFMLNMHQQARITPRRSFLFDLGLSVDANFQSTDSTPSIILLNFMYGVAAYERWKSPPDVGMIQVYFAEHYKPISVPRPRAPSGESKSYLPEDNTMMEVMDELNMVLMYLSGITPEQAAIRQEKRLEEERIAQEAGRRKVTEWMNASNEVEADRTLSNIL